MIAERPYITYTLPVSRTTQALLGGKIETVWTNIQHFLSNCTNADAENPNSIRLVAYSADEDSNEPLEPVNTIIKGAQQLFGKGKTSPTGYMYPSGKPHKQIQIEWDLETGNLNEALHYLISGQPYPVYNLGPIELIISYDFHLLNPLSKEVLPNQQFQSSLLIWLTKRNCVRPNIHFPFIEPGQDFWNYVNSIEPFLPFKFEEKVLRLVSANKKRTDNVWKKITPDSQAEKVAKSKII